MSALSDLKAALEAKREADAAYAALPCGEDSDPCGRCTISVECDGIIDAQYAAECAYDALLTDDTITSLIAVVEAGVQAWLCMSDCPECCNLDVTDDLGNALAPLVKEVGDDHA